MNKNYVIATCDHATEYMYYLKEIDTSYVYGEISTAMRFTYEEALDFLKAHPNLGYLSAIIIRVEDCTFEKLKTDEELRMKFSNPSYVF